VVAALGRHLRGLSFLPRCGSSFILSGGRGALSREPFKGIYYLRWPARRKSGKVRKAQLERGTSCAITAGKLRPHVAAHRAETAALFVPPSEHEIHRRSCRAQQSQGKGKLRPHRPKTQAVRPSPEAKTKRHRQIRSPRKKATAPTQ